jgi:Pyruvate/2-oxoacid:ferredoxin oxidoreductase delta subunit
VKVMNCFIELAAHIDEVYHTGIAPYTDERAFVKIFKVLLSEEEAEIAMSLTDSLITPEVLAVQKKSRTEYVACILESLAMKGIVFQQFIGECAYYRLLPYSPGIVEALISSKMEKEIAGYIKEYVDELEEFKANQSFRVIPANYKIKTRTFHVPFREVQLYLNHTEVYSVTDCLCRQVNKMNGKECGHPIEDMCIQTGKCAEYYINTGRARRVSREMVEKILLQAEQEGLYHEIYIMDDSDSVFLCNCCPCGCLFMRYSGRIQGTVEIPSHIRVHEEICNGCGKCICECPEHSFYWDCRSSKLVFQEELCFNCGLCVLVCEKKAIEMVEA